MLIENKAFNWELDYSFIGAVHYPHGRGCCREYVGTEADITAKSSISRFEGNRRDRLWAGNGILKPQRPAPSDTLPSTRKCCLPSVATPWCLSMQIHDLWGPFLFTPPLITHVLLCLPNLHVKTLVYMSQTVYYTHLYFNLAFSLPTKFMLTSIPNIPRNILINQTEMP